MGKCLASSSQHGVHDWIREGNVGPDDPNELYDLANDLNERQHLIADTAQTGRTREMRQALEDWFAKYVDPDKYGLKYDVTGSGQMRPVGKDWESEEEPFA